MAATAEMIDATRRACGQAALEAVNELPMDQLNPAMIADRAGVETDLACRLFATVTAMVEQGLRDRDMNLQLRLAEDFAEDYDASIHDKVLEALIARYEDYAPLKMAIRHLNRAATRDPVLAAVLINRLNEASRAMLDLAGVDVGGLAGMFRVKGLSGVALSCQREWMADDSSDLSATIRALDKRLKQAENLGQALRLVDQPAGPDASAHE